MFHEKSLKEHACINNKIRHFIFATYTTLNLSKMFKAIQQNKIR